MSTQPTAKVFGRTCRDVILTGSAIASKLWRLGEIKALMFGNERCTVAGDSAMTGTGNVETAAY